MDCERTLETEAEYVKKKDEIQNISDAGKVMKSIIGDITACDTEPSIKHVENHGNLEKLASESCSTSVSSNAEVVETTGDILQRSSKESLNIELIFLEHSYAIYPDCITKTFEEDAAKEEATPSVEESKSLNVSLPVRRSQRQIEKLERELSEKVIAAKDVLPEEQSSKPKIADLKLNITSEDKEQTENLISASSPSSNLCDASIFNGNFDKSKQQIKEENKQETVKNNHLSSDLKTEVKSKLLEGEDSDVNNSFLLNKKTERLRKRKSNIADKNSVSEIKSELPRKTRSCRSRSLQLNKRCNKMTVERKKVVSEANESDLKSAKTEIHQNKRRRNSSKSGSSLVIDNELSSPEKIPTNQNFRKRNPSASSVLGKISAVKGVSAEVVNCHKRKKCASLSEDRVCSQNTESEVEEKKLSIESKDLIQKYPKTVSSPSSQKAGRQKKVLRRESLRFGLSENEPPLFSQPDVMVKVKSDDSPTKKEEKEKCDILLAKKNEKKVTLNSVLKKEEQEKIVSCYKKDDKEKNDLENKIRAICGEVLSSTDEKTVDKKVHLSEVAQTEGACGNHNITHNAETENSCMKEPDLEKTEISEGVIDNVNEPQVAPEAKSLPPSPDCKNSALKSVPDFVLESESNYNEADLKATQESVHCLNDQKLLSSSLVHEQPKPERKSRRLIKKKEFFEDMLSKDSSSSTANKKSSTSQIKKTGDEKQGGDNSKGKRKGRADSNISKVKKTVAEAEKNQPASDSSSEDDPEKLWCICRKPHNDRFMIQCDACEDWFHGSCVNVTRQLGRQLEKLKKEWKCPNCQQKEQMITQESEPTAENSSTSAVLQKTDVPEIKHVKIEESHKISSRKETTSLTEIVAAKSVPSKLNETNNNALIKNEPLTKKCDHIEESKKASKQGESLYQNGGIAKVMNNVEHTLSAAKKKQASVATDKSECKKESVVRNETPTKSVGRKLSDKKNSVNPAKQKVSKDIFKRKQNCVSCQKIASENSCYCSPNCIEKHVADCLKVMKETKGALKGAEFDSQRLVVFDPLKGNVIANDNGPTVGEIVSWLKSNPTFMIACSSPASNTKKSTNSQKQNSDSSTTVAESKESNDESSKAAVRFNVRKTLKNILMDRCKNADDIQMTEDEIRRIAVKIEEELHSLFKDNSFKYRAKYRSLMFNIKDPRNQGLFRKILTGNIPPDRLVHMSSEELASIELAKWREQENQHLLDMIKRVQLEQQKTGSGLLLKKTHKGEVEIEDDFTNILEQDAPKPSQKGVAEELSDGDKPEVQEIAKDTTHLHRSHLFDLNCKICTGKIVPPPAEESIAKKVRVAHSISVDLSSPTPVDPVEKSVSRIVDGKSPASSTGDDSIDQEPTSTVSVGSSEKKSKSACSKKIPSKPATSVWKGFISMQDVAKFVTSAYKVSGQTDHLHVDIPDTIQVCGRIIPDQVWDYLSKIKQSGNKELIIIRFQAANDEEAVTYNSFYSYLSSRKRYGVVSSYSKKIKDFYILPLAATSPVPIVLMPFDGPGLPTPRPHLLLGVIVRHKIRQASPTRISKQNVSEGDQKVVDGSYTPPLETRSYTPPLPKSVDNEGDIVCDSFYSPAADLKMIADKVSAGTRKLKRKSENPYEPSYIPPVKKLPEAEISLSEKDDDKPYDPEQEVLSITSGRQEHKLSPSESSESFDNLEKHKQILETLTRQVEETDRQVNVLKKLISLPDSTDVDEDSPSGQTLDISSVAGTGMSSFLDLPENLQDILNSVRLKSYDKDCVPFENKDIDMRVGHLFQKNSNSVPEKEAHHSMLKVSNVNNCDKSADIEEKHASQGATPPFDEDDDYSVMRPSDPRIKLRTGFQDASFPNDEPVNVSLSNMSVSELVEKAHKQLAEMEAVEHVQATKQIPSDCPNDSASKKPDTKLPSTNWNKCKEPPPPGIELAEMRPQDNLYSTKTEIRPQANLYSTKTVPSLVPNNSVTSPYESTALVHETQRVAPEFPPPPISSFPPPHLPPRFPVQTPPPNLKSFPPPNVISTAFPPPPLPINALPPKGAENTVEKPWPPWQISGQQSEKNDWNNSVHNWENQQGRHNVDYSDSNSQYYQPERSGNYQKEQFYKNDFSSDNQWERSQRFDRGRWFRHPVRGRRWENQRQRRAFSYGRQHRN